MQESNISISKQNIIEAFRAISNPLTPSPTISAANEYLNQCQKSPKFALTLIDLYSSSAEQAIQLQSILLLLNLVKRNWQSRRGRGHSEQMQSFEAQKPAIRRQIIRIYPLYNLGYVKHINQVLKYLARQDYPAKYLELQQFILSSLHSLNNDVLVSRQAIQHQKQLIIGLLSTVKIIIKQYASKRLSHSQQGFSLYISQVIKAIYPVSEKCHQLIGQLMRKECGQNDNDEELLLTLVESAKKADKIILYSLLCMPNSLQYLPEVQKIFQTVLNNISIFDNYLSIPQKQQSLKQSLESYLAGVLQQAYKVQSLYPFLLVDTLQNYLHMILKMLLNNIPAQMYKTEKIVLAIIQANLKVFTCFTYYMSQEDFAGSIYNRKGSNNIQLQTRCHNQFKSVFSNQNIPQLLQKLITQVMLSPSINPTQRQVIDHQMILQQNQAYTSDTLGQSTPYQLCILLCKNIIKCFKKQVKPLLQGLFLSIYKVDNTNARSQKVIENTMQIILTLPKIYDECQLPLQHVMNLLQVLFHNHQYAILARLIKNYHEYLNHTTLQNSFNVLSQIVSTPLTNQHINIDIIYQCALTMKKILTENQSDIFSFQNFSSCIINLLVLLKDQKFKKTPTLMWPLIKLANQLLKLTNVTIVIEEIGEKIIDCIFPMVEEKGSEELTVYGFAEIVQNLLSIICSCFKQNYLCQQPSSTTSISKSTIKILYTAYTLIITNLTNNNLQNIDTLYMLWLSLLRNYPTIKQQQLYNLNKVPEILTLNNSMKELFTHLFHTVLEEDSICAVQVLEESIIVGLVELNEQELLNVFQKVLTNCLQEHKIRAYTALFSMYYCHMTIQSSTNNLTIQKDILHLILQTLITYQNQISPQINGLRTLIMLVVNFSILKFGVKNIYELFSSFCGGNYAKWFYNYCWSAQYVSSKLSHKVNSVAYLKAIEELGATVFGNMLKNPIDGQYPLDTALKTMVISLQPMKLSQAWNTLSNMYKLILPTETAVSSIGTTISRKIKLQLSGIIRQILVNDQRGSYQKLVSQLFKYWDWGQDDITERFDKITSNEIIMLVNGNYKKQYDINEPD